MPRLSLEVGSLLGVLDPFGHRAQPDAIECSALLAPALPALPLWRECIVC